MLTSWRNFATSLRAIAETDRRRNKQFAFNKTNKITPISVHRRIKDLIGIELPAE